MNVRGLNVTKLDSSGLCLLISALISKKPGTRHDLAKAHGLRKAAIVCGIAGILWTFGVVAAQNYGILPSGPGTFITSTLHIAAFCAGLSVLFWFIGYCQARQEIEHIRDITESICWVRNRLDAGHGAQDAVRDLLHPGDHSDQYIKDRIEEILVLIARWVLENEQARRKMGSGSSHERKSLAEHREMRGYLNNILKGFLFFKYQIGKEHSTYYERARAALPET